MDSINEVFSQRLKEKRNSLGISQSELARRCGVSKTTISRYEAGNYKNVLEPVITKLAQVLNCNPVWLSGLTDDESLNSLVISQDDNLIVIKDNATISLIKNYESLNKKGKQLAHSTIEAMSLNPDLTNNDNQLQSKFKHLIKHIDNLEVDENLKAAHYDYEGKSQDQVDKDFAHDEDYIKNYIKEHSDT